MLVIKLGGCNGSGKTSVARALLEKYRMVPIEYKNNRPYVYAGQDGLLGLSDRRLVVLGSYASVCGGMDTISDKNERLALLRGYARPDGHNVVFYEGLITGKTYGAMGAMSDEPTQKGRWLYAFMDTPFEVCVERVQMRRRERAIAKGADAVGAEVFARELDAERTMRPTYKSIQSTEARARAAGHKTLWLPHDKTPASIAATLMSAAVKML